MNVLVTGANGQLGNELRVRATSFPNIHFIFSDVSEQDGSETVYLDITNKDAVKIIAESEQVDVIVNCAAYTNVDKAEEDIAFAQMLNCTAVENLAAAAKEVNATLVHISTDYVFSGKASKPVKETDSPDPRSVYGATKLAGEKALKDSGCKGIVIRTAWLYSPFGKNFVKTMLRLTEQNSSIKVVCDQVGTPTYAGDLADVILKIISEGLLDKTGIYHFSDEGAISWYDFAQAILEMSGNECTIDACSSEEFPSKATRPHYSVLDKTLIKKTFGIRVPYWKDSLAQCMNKLK